MTNTWYKNEETDFIWWLDNGDEVVGEWVFSFDKKKLTTCLLIIQIL